MDFKDILEKYTWQDVLNMPQNGQYISYRFCKEPKKTIRQVEQRFSLTEGTRLTEELFNRVKLVNPRLTDWFLYAASCNFVELSAQSRLDLAKRIESFFMLHKTYDEIPGLDAQQDSYLDALREEAREKESQRFSRK